MKLKQKKKKVYTIKTRKRNKNKTYQTEKGVLKQFIIKQKEKGVKTGEIRKKAMSNFGISKSTYYKYRNKDVPFLKKKFKVRIDNKPVETKINVSRLRHYKPERFRRNFNKYKNGSRKLPSKLLKKDDRNLINKNVECVIITTVSGVELEVIELPEGQDFINDSDKYFFNNYDKHISDYHKILTVNDGNINTLFNFEISKAVRKIKSENLYNGNININVWTAKNDVLIGKYNIIIRDELKNLR